MRDFCQTRPVYLKAVGGKGQAVRAEAAGRVTDPFRPVRTEYVDNAVLPPIIAVALAELYRITRNGGLVLVSFDTAEDSDFGMAHEVLPDGSLRYAEGTPRAGMIFHPTSSSSPRNPYFPTQAPPSSTSNTAP